MRIVKKLFNVCLEFFAGDGVRVGQPGRARGIFKGLTPVFVRTFKTSAHAYLHLAFLSLSSLRDPFDLDFSGFKFSDGWARFYYAFAIAAVQTFKGRKIPQEVIDDLNKIIEEGSTKSRRCNLVSQSEFIHLYFRRYR